LNLRVSSEAKALIERAAILMGTTVSAFMLHNTYEAARRVVEESQTLMLSGRAFDDCIAQCEADNALPTSALRKMMARA
jgi:uncharacterized protein (DUF1778 family)